MESKFKFTDDAVKGLKPNGNKPQTVFWDEELRGFGIRLSAKGKAVYFVQFRDRTGRQGKLTIGDAKTLTATKARTEAKVALGKVSTGGNPQVERRAERKADRVLDVVEAYLAQAQTRLRPKSYADVKRTLEKFAKPLHHDKIDGVQRSDVTRLLDKAARELGPYAANRARAHLSALWTWAMRQGSARGPNPVANTPTAVKETPRDRVLSDDELALIWHCTEGAHDHDRIVRLLLLTAARREEVGAMAWDEIAAFEGSSGAGTLWTLPAARSKNRQAHEVPVCALALAQLPERRDGCSAVFGRPTGDPKGFSGWSKCKARLDVRMQAALRQEFINAHGREPKPGEAQLVPWRLHDLRRTFSTGCNEMGVEPHVVEAVLNHVSGAAKAGVAGVYNRARYRSQKQATLAVWETRIRRVCGLAEKSNVVALRATG